MSTATQDHVPGAYPLADIVGGAADIARRAHHGQVDRAGHPYIGHPTRVAGLVRDQLGGDEFAVAAAWLHDTLEDTPVTERDLVCQGFPPDVTRAVEAVTKRDGEPDTAYARRIAANRRAIIVKRADLMDNTNPERLEALDEPTRARLTEKYERFARLLDESVALRDEWSFVDETFDRMCREHRVAGRDVLTDGMTRYVHASIGRLCDTPDEALTLLETLSPDGVVTYCRPDAARRPVMRGVRWGIGIAGMSTFSVMDVEVTVFDDGSYAIADLTHPATSGGRRAKGRATSPGVDCLLPPGELAAIRDDPAGWLRQANHVPDGDNSGWTIAEL